MTLGYLDDDTEHMYPWTSFLISDKNGKDFKENSRKHHNGLSLSSAGVQMDQPVYGSQGVYNYRSRVNDIIARIYRMGSFLAVNGDDPTFAQIFLYNSEPEHQIDRRMNWPYEFLLHHI